MRPLLCVLIGLSGGVMPAAADPVFVPPSKAPDHIVSFVDRQLGREEDTRTVVRRGRWTRVEMVNSQRRATSYTEYDNPARVSIWEESSGRRVSIVRDPKFDPIYPWQSEPRATGEQQTLLGERCTVWSADRLPAVTHLQDAVRLSCVTDDGITLWYKVVQSSRVTASGEATRLERRAIAPHEVLPPPALLALDWWKSDAFAPSLRTPPEHEAVMHAEGFADSEKRVRTTRYRYPWQYIEETLDGVRTSLDVSHVSTGMSFSYNNANAYQPEQVAISQYAAPRSDASQSLNRYETILGEQCRWFDIHPGAMDAGVTECRTGDGIVLKWVNWSRGGSRSWTAVRVQRHNVSLAEVTPPSALLELKAWGLEE